MKNLRESPSELKSVMIEVPTLIIWGEKDEALTTYNLEGLDEYIPDLKIKRIPEGSHWIINEEPDKVNSLIREFL
jgi:pimeloyl-ACP methyl ester carboxylesterase